MTSIQSRRPLRALSAVVLAVLLALTAVSCLVVRSVVADQQERLLKERATEAGALVGTLFGSVGSPLSALAANVPTSPGAIASFNAAAQQDLGLAGALGALQPSPAGFKVLAAVGTGPRAGATINPDRAALAQRALGTKGMVDSTVQTAKGPRLSFAVAVGGVVFYEDLAFDPNKAYNLGASGPFSELDGVLYASSNADPSSVVITTTSRLPLSGTIERQTVQVGSQNWLLVVRSKEPLVGWLAAKAPWGVLVGGLMAALFATVLVETLSRRRGYALALVDERTAALREALEQQARLEQGQRQAREAAETANRAKSDFLSRMSHELRTPLNAILGFGQLLELDELGPTQQESVDQILKGGRHLLDLINEILDISRIETGSLALSPEPVSVGEAVADVVTLMQPLADERRVRLTSEPAVPGESDQGLHVLADRQRLKQILLNLVANAIKYNRDGGIVTVAYHTDGESQLRISVIDNGPGIRSEDLGRLFTPFERLGAEATGVEGSGVGLALCRRLAEAMGGTVDVESTFGQGSRFSVQLPLVEGPLQRHERLHGVATESPDERKAESGRRKILYIEDNLSNLRLIERVLGARSDLEVIPAMQGRLGLELAREIQPAAILLDLHLPDLGGDEVLRQIRADDLTSTIPVLILSADATAGQVERLMAEGADAYLTKPLDVRELNQVLTDKLDGVGASRPD